MKTFENVSKWDWIEFFVHIALAIVFGIIATIVFGTPKFFTWNLQSFTWVLFSWILVMFIFGLLLFDWVWIFKSLFKTEESFKEWKHYFHWYGFAFCIFTLNVYIIILGALHLIVDKIGNKIVYKEKE